MLTLNSLPDLPQCARLRPLTEALWADPNVHALWLGGSLARGTADAFSDIDLRIALASSLTTLPESAMLLLSDAVVHLSFPLGDDATLHHILVSDGTIWDIFVQSPERAPANEARIVLACRDDALAAQLTGGSDPPPVTFPPATPEAVCNLLQSFWINQQKHLKVLHRGLGLLAWQGEHLMRLDVLRLHYIAATGNDCGSPGHGTIHTLTPLVGTVQDHFGAEVLALLGTPRRTEGELLAGARILQNAVAALGRRLAEQLGFVYPTAAEETVRRSWEAFRA